MQRIPDREDSTTSCSIAATACSGSSASAVDYTEVDAVVISHLHADHFLDLVPYSYALTYAPRQQPVPVHTWPGTDIPARPRLIAPARRRGDVSPGGRRVGQRRPDRERLRHRGVLGRRTGSRSATLARRAFRRSRTSPRRSPSTSAPRTAAAESPTAPTARPNDELVEIARGTDLLIVEGDPAAPRAHRPARPPDPRGGGRARQAGGREARRAHAHLGRARRGLGAQAGRGRRSAARSRSPRGRGILRRSERPSAAVGSRSRAGLVTCADDPPARPVR